MELEDFRLVMDVHLMGSVHCTKAVWDMMREQNYGRIVMTTSSSGLYGNFGQSNYGSAKAGVIGLMNVLAQEGRKNNIRVNTLSPQCFARRASSARPRRRSARSAHSPVAPPPLVSEAMHRRRRLGTQVRPNRPALPLLLSPNRRSRP